MRIKIFIIALMLLMILNIGNVFAIGVTPGRVNLNYNPGQTEKIEFTVVNTEAEDMNVVVLVQGELNKSISVSEVSFKMTADERERKLSYSINIPSDLKPGPHVGEIAVIQLPDKIGTGEAFIGAAVGVITQVYVFVPYPGKYAESDLNVVGPDDNGKIVFLMPVISRGELDLVRVRGTIDIYTSLNEKITTLNTNEISVNSGQRNEVAVEWDTKDVLPGPYRAVATLLYDEDSLTIEKEFNVGQRKLEVENIEVNDFSLGGIAKFEILVNNKWSQKITGVYARMLIYNDKEEVMADFKSQTYDLSPLEKTLMVAFWDTDGVRKGTYDSSLFLNYGDTSEQRDFELEVSDNEINIVGIGYVISKGRKSGGTLTVVLVVAVVVLVLINLAWFLVLRKRMKKK